MIDNMSSRNNCIDKISMGKMYIKNKGNIK